jgi:hypothetical protein
VVIHVLFVATGRYGVVGRTGIGAVLRSFLMYCISGTIQVTESRLVVSPVTYYQSRHWRFSFSRLPGGLTRRLFPECFTSLKYVKTEDG